MRRSERKLNPSLKRQIRATLTQVIADIKDPEEAETFLSEFFTDSEYDAFAKRLAVAYWLKKGRSYSNIKRNLKVSSATIASVQSESQNPGFRIAISKVEAEEWANQWAERIKKFVK